VATPKNVARPHYRHELVYEYVYEHVYESGHCQNADDSHWRIITAQQETQVRNKVPSLSNEHLTAALLQRKEEHLYRSRKLVTGKHDVETIIDGNSVLSFCSNDYLGLASHPDVITALQQGAAQFGVGSGASHLVSGHNQTHHALEEELAEFVQRERALLFSTGYMANLGVISALLKRGDQIFEDRLNHASLLDAARLSLADRRRYAHIDAQSLNRRLSETTRSNGMIITDGVFSMDGDIAPLPKIAALAQQHHTSLMVDDAHGFGVLGDTGAGCVEHFGLTSTDVPILMGTLGKALGSFGAFVAGDEALIETLIQQARSYVYTTALPPALVHATRTGLKLLVSESWRRDKLKQLIRRFRAGAQQLGIPLTPSETAIQPIIIGASDKALRVSEALLASGLYVSAIRPPTVAQGTARLRITLSANHSENHVDQLLQALEKTL